jgi:3-deoxy-manno-octulosonate cytidylyltransferase (CMP-KDO synthetase)
MDSIRLPGKALMKVHGTPMVVRVAQQCSQAIGIENVIVSTPDKAIFDISKEYGFKSIYSSIECKTGTDRLYEYILNSNENLIFNVQGDEPMIPISVIQNFYNQVLKSGKSCIGIAPITKNEDIFNTNVVKVAVSDDKLIYASRSPIATSSQNERVTYFKHTGLYSFSKQDLLLFGNSKPKALERLEKIEILRLIEIGLSVSTVEIPNYGRSVDTLQDLNHINSLGDS